MTWLSGTGAWAAAAVGIAVWFGAGWRGLALLALFFVTSSLLTRGGGRRRAGQVFANGGVAAVCALLSLNERAWILGFAGALAAAAADTWATEIGARSSRPPRLITTWRPVAAGTDGGVTVLGSGGGLLGAVTIALASWPLGFLSIHQAPAVLIAGVAGGLLDSLLGATAQRWKWLNNDGVNFACTFAGAVVAMALG